MSAKKKTTQNIQINDFLLNPKLQGQTLGSLSGVSKKEIKAIDATINTGFKKKLKDLTGVENEIVAKVIDNIPVDYKNATALNIKEFAEVYIQPELQKQNISKEIVKAVQKNIEATANTKVKDWLQLEQPIVDNPMLQAEKRKIQAQEFGTLANLKPENVQKLIAQDIHWDTVNEASFYQLEQEGVMTTRQKQRLVLTAHLGKLTGTNIKLIKSLQQDQKITSLQDLIGYDQEDWIAHIKKSKAATPSGEQSIATYAENLRVNIEKTYPEAYFKERILGSKINFEPKIVAVLKSLKLNKKLLFDKEAMNTAAIDWTGIKKREQKKILHDLDTLTAFGNTYKYMGIKEVLNNKQLSVTKKQAAIQKKVALLQTFKTNNPTLSIVQENFFEKTTQLNWKNIPAKEKVGIRKQLLSYQRVHTLSNDFNTQKALLSKGLDSAFSIASRSEKDFIQHTGLSLQEGHTTYNRARDLLARTINLAESVRDLKFSDFNNTNVSNTHRLRNVLQEVDGYEELFGNQDFCSCEHCRSILSPAAYFTDLMLFIKEHTEKQFQQTKSKENHPLYLKKRRPDLWDIKFSCAHTTDEITYLEVVNKVLECYIDEEDAFEEISKSNSSINLPMNVPLEETRLFLSHFDLTLHDIYKMVKHNAKDIWRAYLKISDEEFELISNPNETRSHNVFGNTAFTVLKDVQEFIRYAKITRDELDQLLTTSFFTEISNIKVEMVNIDPTDIQQYREELKGLTKKRLDVAHRYLRLWKKTNWTISQFDFILNAIKKSTGLSSFQENAGEIIILIAQWKAIAEQLRLSVEELEGFIGAFSEEGIKGQAKKPLVKRLFEYDKVSIEKIDNQEVRPLLLIGLGIDESDIISLIEFLEIHDSKKIDSNVLANLFRVSRLSRALKLSINELVFLAKESEHINLLETPDEIFELIKITDAFKASPFNVQDVLFISKGVESVKYKYINTNQDRSESLSSDEKLAQQNQKLYDILELTKEDIEFLNSHKEIFSITDLSQLSLKNMITISYYKRLFTNIEDDNIVEIQDALKTYQSTTSFTAILKGLSRVWEVSEIQLTSIVNSFLFSSDALEAFRFLQELVQLSNTLGISGENLSKYLESDYTVTKDLAKSAFAHKYAEEDILAEKLAPYVEKINAIKRDALCDYIMGIKSLNFKDKNDLYQYFLLDVEMSECFKTSQIVAGISSVQLYIHRCLMNLEQTDSELLDEQEDELVVNFTDTAIKEWEWRKNYRVWEANRKVFLYPENYIEPSLRNDKTHIFKELEDELLQEKITQESAEAAYKKYFSQFSELTKLRYAGAYYEEFREKVKIDYIGFREQPKFRLESHVSDDSKYYLFARTNTDPYQYYYRTYNHNKTVWGNWIKMEVAIEAEEISSLIYNGRLYVFWTDVESKEINRFDGGTSISDGVQFKIYTKYAFLKEDGKWSVPQRVYVGYLFFSERQLFQSILNYYPEGDQKMIDEKKDIILKTFKKLSFSKPYAWVDVKQIKLTFIWEKIKIKVWEIKVPKQRVEYINGILTTNILESLSFTGEDVLVGNEISMPIVRGSILVKTVFSHVLGQHEETHYAELTIDADGTAYISIHLNAFGFTIKESKEIKLEIVTEDKVRASDFYFSEFQNEIVNIKERDIFHSENVYFIDNDDRFLQGRTLFGYDNQNILIGYVENGRRDFAKNSRKLSQSSTNTTYLSPFPNNYSFEKVPLNTTSNDELIQKLYSDSIEKFLSINTQNSISDSTDEELNFNDSYGNYYWELFFHIPYTIANHLNANQKFKEAKWWYERVFNPTSLDTKDSNWQFKEFRNNDIEKLQEMLVNGDAIEAYKEDPFDSHAIAKQRITAYQKSIVMKYIDNLLDWGDYLFTQDTRESIHEAMMLYQLAADILGDSPVQLGKCENISEHVLNLQKIEETLNNSVSSEFLITLENAIKVLQLDYQNNVAPVKAQKQLMNRLQNLGVIAKPDTLKELQKQRNQKRLLGTATPFVNKITTTTMTAPVLNVIQTNTSIFSYHEITQNQELLTKPYQQWKDWDSYFKPEDLLVNPTPKLPSFEIVMQTQSKVVFCVPNNNKLLQYWDRVQDRMFKIRHCMNISGVRRSLALFQPPIDPALLIRAKAAGMRIEDILDSLHEQPPIYRFEYLLNKAKSFVQTVQSFGGALLSALEKKDAEKLGLLRSVHEQNILKLTKNIKKKQLQEAQYQYKASQEGIKNIQNRIDYYQSLKDTGLIPWEITQLISKHQATLLKQPENAIRLLAGVNHLVPELGSPFSLKFGGKQLGDSANVLAQWMSGVGSILESVSISASIEASFQRREEEWNQQLKVATQELKQLDQQLLAAEIRMQIAEKDLEIHKTSIEQSKALYDFYKGEFTGLSLYNFMSKELTKLYRHSYTMALDMAKQAEKAYQFEQDDEKLYITGNNWDSSKAGLLAGERLLLQLQEIEQSYVSNNKRQPEITQTFSLTMLDPQQLIELRQNGSCDFTIPEIAFDMLYPGQYKRLIKSVRLTIPSVVGPYTNVSAKLTFKSGKLKKEPLVDNKPEAFTIGKGTSISTSTAINDTGMFEFNFRDERYLPFEGAGAVDSEWKLELPSTVRSFNYDTISDVLLTISYTALEGNTSYREDVEGKLQNIISTYSQENGMFRLISLKQEFPSQFHILTNSTKSSVESVLQLTQNHFPYFLKTRSLKCIGEISLYIKSKPESIRKPIDVKLNGNEAIDNNWKEIKNNSQPDNSKKEIIWEGKFKSQSTETIIGKDLKIEFGQAIEKNKIDDVMILIKYKAL